MCDLTQFQTEKLPNGIAIAPSSHSWYLPWRVQCLNVKLTTRKYLSKWTRAEAMWKENGNLITSPINLGLIINIPQPMCCFVPAQSSMKW